MDYKKARQEMEQAEALRNAKVEPMDLLAHQLGNGMAVPAAYETDESNQENALKLAKLRALQALQEKK